MQGGFKNWNIPSKDIAVFKRPSNQWRKEYAEARYPTIALHKVDQVFKYYITSL